MLVVIAITPNSLRQIFSSKPTPRPLPSPGFAHASHVTFPSRLPPTLQLEKFVYPPYGFLVLVLRVTHFAHKDLCVHFSKTLSSLRPCDLGCRKERYFLIRQILRPCVLGRSLLSNSMITRHKQVMATTVVVIAITPNSFRQVFASSKPTPRSFFQSPLQSAAV